MMIECMAAKSACVSGGWKPGVHDGTPFLSSEDNNAIDYYGTLLQKGKHGLLLFFFNFHNSLFFFQLDMITTVRRLSTVGSMAT